MKQLALDIGLVREPSLESFYDDGRNALALELLTHWLDTIFRGLAIPSPLYLWGSVSSGKTHLIHAMYSAIRGRAGKIGWLDAKSTYSPEFDENWVAVLMDDVDQFNDEQQSTAFNWFINAQTYGTAILSTGALSPSKLPHIRDDLRTRLCWGDVCQLLAQDDEGQRQILLSEADSRGIHLSKEVVNFLQIRFSRDMANLKELFDMLDTFSLENKRVITVPLLKLMLETI